MTVIARIRQLAETKQSRGKLRDSSLRSEQAPQSRGIERMATGLPRVSADAESLAMTVIKL